LSSQLYKNLQQDKDAVDVTIKAEGAVHLRTLVMKERVTVMDLVMEVVMMAMQGVKENLFVAVIIARSLVHIIMTRMTVVKNQNQRIHQLLIQLHQHLQLHKHLHLHHGESGRHGASAQGLVEEGHGQGRGAALVQGADTPLSLRKDSVTSTLAS